MALTLLREDIVVNATAERALTAVRRTLLMEGQGARLSGAVRGAGGAGGAERRRLAVRRGRAGAARGAAGFRGPPIFRRAPPPRRRAITPTR
ncbi:MAG: hypothetical protein WDM81_06005 [Rhizomicrobium sp.]